MNEILRQPIMRPFFRGLARIIAYFFYLMQIIFAFGIFGAEVNFEAFMASGLCGILFSIISKKEFNTGLLQRVRLILLAMTGNLTIGIKQRLLLFVAAKKYSNNEITLKEYGELTKDIMKMEPYKHILQRLMIKN